MNTYAIAGRVIADDAPEFPGALRDSHGSLPRPRCLCQREGVEMYVARIGTICIVKRMPDSGPQHALNCPSYEPPAEVSGLGAVIGSAIKVNPLDGTTALKLDFSMSAAKEGASKAATVRLDQHGGQVASQAPRLSLRALLHYLWSEAGFHRWSPAMKDKRNWYVLRKYLLQAAQDKRIRGLSLADALFVPETFIVDKTDAIHRRRIAAMNLGLDAVKSAPSNRMKLLLAEVKEIAPSRFGKKLVVKHLPDQVILLTDELASKMNKQYGAELELWNAMNEFHLIVFGTFSVSKNGIALMDALTLMLTTAEWLPVENQHGIRLVDGLVRAQRRFDTCLRYNLPADKPLASAVLADAEAPLAMYLCPPETPDHWRADLTRLQSESALQSWTWHCGVEEFPTLPPRRSANPLR